MGHVPKKGGVSRAFEWFLLKVPQSFVLAVLWLTGVALIGLCLLILYLFWLLLRVAVGG